MSYVAGKNATEGKEAIVDDVRAVIDYVDHNSDQNSAKPGITVGPETRARVRRLLNILTSYSKCLLMVHPLFSQCGGRDYFQC